MRKETVSSLTKKIAGCKQGLALAKKETCKAIRDYSVSYWEKAILGHELTMAMLRGEPAMGWAMAKASAEIEHEKLVPAYNAALNAMRTN